MNSSAFFSLETFNPYSEKNRTARQEFKELSLTKKIYIVSISTLLALSIVFTIFAVPVFTHLVKKYKVLNNANTQVPRPIDPYLQRNRNSYQNHKTFNTTSPKEVASLAPIQKKELEKVLSNLETGSFLEKLTSFLNDARIYSEENETNQWTLATYYLFDQGSISTADCRPRLEWENCDAYTRNAESISLKNGFIRWTSDALNDQFFHINALSIKTSLQTLDKTDKEKIINAIIDPSNQLPKDLVEVYDTLKESSESIRKQYHSKIISNENGFSYQPDIRSKIHNLLKEIILEKNTAFDFDDVVEQLMDPIFSEEVCTLLVERLFESVSIDKEKTSLDFGDGLILSFAEEIDSELIPYDALKKTTNYPANDLISKNYTEDPKVLDHAFKIASDQHNAKLEPGSPISLDPERKKTFISWIKKNYYNSFCTKYVRSISKQSLRNQEKIEIPPKTIPINSPKKQTRTIKKDNQLFSNCYHHIDKVFTREYSWDVSGSCLLSCFLHEPKIYSCREQIISPIREEIASLLEENKKDYIELVEVSNSLCANENQWVISQENSEKSKIQAISLRATEIAATRTYLTSIEIGLLTNILKTPIHIYREDAESFEVDASNHIVPHVIYGEQYKERPPYNLLLSYSHYQPLIPKNGKPPKQDIYSVTLSSGSVIPFRFPSSPTRKC